MKQLVFLLILLSFSAHGETVFSINIGNKHKKYSREELQRRVFDLERAVFQLQQKVFKLETTNQTTNAAASWICKVRGLHTTYSGLGGSKAIAEHNAFEKCKGKDPSNGFHCSSKASCNN